MTLLARLFTLGIAKETTPAAGGVATYQAPVRWIPCTGPKPEDVIAPLRDESIRGNDDVLQGVYGGSVQCNFDFTVPHLYPDVTGDFLRAIIGPDSISGGASTTLAAATTVGATSFSVPVSIPAGSLVRLDTTTKTEYVTTGTPTGSGPFVIPVVASGVPNVGNSTTLQIGHASAATVQVATLHTFAQDQRATVIPSYSLTWYDKAETRGVPGAIESDLAIKIDPKGGITADPKWVGFPSAVQTNATAAYSSVQPFLGWQWSLTINGVASTRGVSGEWDWKRSTEAIQASDGTQGPREVFPGALELDYKMKAIFDDNTDQSTFLNYNEVPIISTLTQPLAFGGAVLTVTSTAQKFTKFALDFSGAYTTADIEASGRFNSTDNGTNTVKLLNFVATAY